MMIAVMMEKSRRLLIAHEGYRSHPYIDPVGKITIGVGYNLSDRGLDDEWINNQLEKDIQYFYHQLSFFPWFTKLNTDRQIVLIDMCFMGFKKFLEFKEMISALEVEDYKKASEEMLDSEWANQVKGRATQLAAAMECGEYTI